MKTSTLIISTSWLLGAVAQSQPAPSFYPCPFLGRTYPRPTNIPNAQPVQKAAQNVTAVIEEALATGLLDNQTTAFSVTAFSTSDKDSNPFFAYHQTPPILAQTSQGVKKITSDSVYRLGSLSKIITVYTLLVTDGFKHWQNPITDFIPGLLQNSQSPGSNVNWSATTDWTDISLEALSSHLGGIGVEYGALDIAKSPFPYTEIGLPKVPANQLPPCGGPLGSPLCTRQQTIHGLTQKDPVFPPFYTPSYSNVAFQLLSYAIESITGGTAFPTTLKSKVFDPLGMSHSFYYKPSDSLGVIPTDSPDLFWNVSAGDLTPAAAMYSSPHDLARFGRAVLSYQQLTATQTRRWMKPVTHTSDPFNSVGSPWEIVRYRLPNDPYKVVDLYTKSGDFGLYTAYIILVADYGVGFSVNVAGSLGATPQLANVLTESFVPALEEAARQQATTKYAGHYVSEDGQYAFTLSSQPQDPGLHLTNFTGPKGSNEFATLAALALVAAGHYEEASVVIPYFQNGSASAAYAAGLFDVEVDLRLYPTTLEETVKYNPSPPPRYISFRAAYGVSQTTGPGPFTPACSSWDTIDTIVLSGKSLDEFVFEINGNGEVVSVNNGFLRQTFTRKGVSGRGVARGKVE